MVGDAGKMIELIVEAGYDAYVEANYDKAPPPQGDKKKRRGKFVGGFGFGGEKPRGVDLGRSSGHIG